MNKNQTNLQTNAVASKNQTPSTNFYTKQLS